MVSRYRFAEYSAEWAREFEEEAERLRVLLGDLLVEVHHIGSTSVPGLAAKPVIDLLPLVSDLEPVKAMDSEFEQAGYKVWGEYGIPGRLFFTRDRDGERTHNIHLFEVGATEAERHLAFCAYLRAHEEARLEYEALKRMVYAQSPDDIEAYCDGKDEWIKRVEKIAVEWWRERR